MSSRHTVVVGLAGETAAAVVRGRISDLGDSVFVMVNGRLGLE